ncbi:MAG TPA: hypothetical protein VIO64_12780 [Pseudobacteroides sp.]|uniref:hypothetical protein n=1 Tax=Pseudobacteroides sp. TaxID=1968840 RepID=UPI002F91CDF7
MDWSKAKNILLVVFIVLNSILLYNNYMAFSGGGIILSDELSSNTLTVLASRGIGVNCEIPSAAKGATLIFGQYLEDRHKIADALLGSKARDEIEEGKIIGEGTKEIIFHDNSFEFKDDRPMAVESITDLEKARMMLEGALEKTGIPYEDFKIESKFAKDSIYRFEYKQVYEDYILFDNYIKAEIGASGIKKLDFKYRNVRGIKKNTTQKTVDAYQILLKMTDIKNVDINNIDIGYGDFSDNDIPLFDVLAWRVRFSDGSESFYNAFNGQKLSLP